MRTMRGVRCGRGHGGAGDARRRRGGLVRAGDRGGIRGSAAEDTVRRQLVLLPVHAAMGLVHAGEGGGREGEGRRLRVYEQDTAGGVNGIRVGHDSAMDAGEAPGGYKG